MGVLVDRPTLSAPHCTCQFVSASNTMRNTPIQEPSIFDFDGDNGLDLLIFVRITFPEIFSVLNGREQKAYRILNPQKS